MGCGNSTTARYELLWSSQWAAALEVTKMSKHDVFNLFRSFDVIDVDHSGTISLQELLVFLRMEENFFARRVFSVFDQDGSNQIDFGEFAMSCWNYCTLSRGTLVNFAFKLYDNDGSGSISKDELKVMVEDLFGGHFHRNSHATKMLATLTNTLHQYEPPREGIVLEEFQQLTMNHSIILFPAFEMQRNIQRRVVGVEFWTRLSDAVYEMSDGRKVTLSEYKDLTIFPNTFTYKSGPKIEQSDATALAPAIAATVQNKAGDDGEQDDDSLEKTRESARPMRPVMLSSVPDLVASKYGALKSPSHAIRLYGDTAADTAKNAKVAWLDDSNTALRGDAVVDLSVPTEVVAPRPRTSGSKKSRVTSLETTETGTSSVGQGGGNPVTPRGRATSKTSTSDVTGAASKHSKASSSKHSDAVSGVPMSKVLPDIISNDKGSVKLPPLPSGSKLAKKSTKIVRIEE